jgi:hypothetical protein
MDETIPAADGYPSIEFVVKPAQHEDYPWTAAWKTIVDGKQYGNWVWLEDNSPATVAEAKQTLLAHARLSIDAIKGGK